MTEIDFAAIGRRIRAVRESKMISQEALAAKVGVNSQHISNIERDHAHVSLPTLVKIANVLDTSVDDLLCDNVLRSGHIYNRQAQEILRECNDYEMRILLDIMRAAKKSFDGTGAFKDKIENLKTD